MLQLILSSTTRWGLLAFVVAATFWPQLAVGQESDVVYKKHTVLSFGDDTIDGDLSRPDGQYIDARKRQRHRSLIKVRETFRQEILRSVRLL